MKKYITENWNDYELIDFGNGKKLERFGKIILIRPEMQANGPKSLSNKEWKKLAHGEFIEGKKQKGQWNLWKEVPKEWRMSWSSEFGKVVFNCRLTQFKHLGVFPEQGDNWRFVQESIDRITVEEVKLLNLFAYTGGASIAGRLTGAKVTHVDSIKQVVTWSRENMESSGVEGIRWIIEDALKFAEKEKRRGNKYHGIIMDPPSWGRGPKGEIWKIEDQLEQLIATCSHLQEDEFFMVLNTYSGMNSSTTEGLLKDYFRSRDIESGTLYLSTQSGRIMPTGTLNRIIN